MADNKLILVPFLLSRLMACLKFNVALFNLLLITQRRTMSSLRSVVLSNADIAARHRSVTAYQRLQLWSFLFPLILPCFSIVFRVNWRLLQSLI